MEQDVLISMFFISMGLYIQFDFNLSTNCATWRVCVRVRVYQLLFLICRYNCSPFPVNRVCGAIGENFLECDLKWSAMMQSSLTVNAYPSLTRLDIIVGFFMHSKRRLIAP